MLRGLRCRKNGVKASPHGSDEEVGEGLEVRGVAAAESVTFMGSGFVR